MRRAAHAPGRWLLRTIPPWKLGNFRRFQGRRNHVAATRVFLSPLPSPAAPGRAKPSLLPPQRGVALLSLFSPGANGARSVGHPRAYQAREFRRLIEVDLLQFLSRSLPIALSLPLSLDWLIGESHLYLRAKRRANRSIDKTFCDGV